MQPISRYRLDPTVALFSVRADELPEKTCQHGKTIGQPRAVEALKLAIAIRAKGYNVYAAGYSGTGKRSTVMRILREQPFEPDRLRDIGIVNNFLQPDRPRVLYFSPGDALRFRRRVRSAITELRDNISSILEQSWYRKRRDRIMLDTETDESKTLSEFERRVKKQGFAIVQVNEGEEQRSDLNPVIDGEHRPIEETSTLVQSGELSEEDWSDIRGRYHQLMDQMNGIFVGLRRDRLQAEGKLRDLQREALSPYVEKLVQAMSEDFAGPDIREHLELLKADILENLALFLPEDAEKSQELEQEFLRYDVNVVVDHSHTDKTPIIFESHPDYHKLFGAQEANPELDGRFGFLSLRGGSLLSASGGYLILRAEDVLTQEDLWNSLKRALQDEVTEIRTPPTPHGPPTPGLKPDPIKLDVKVVLMGNEHIYDLLFYEDEEFGKLFKVLSEFDSVMPHTAESRQAYVDFIHMICDEERLLPTTREGNAAVIEYGVRLSEFRDKLSTRFSLIADLLRESSHWARLDGKDHIDRSAVELARDKRKYLHNLPEEKYDEQLSSGEMILQVDGDRIGAINGLSVLDRGYYAFGRPMLITARVAPGNDGIINIERESGLSGELHDKGIYIIQGFLQATYATDFPLSINASIGFEQSYAEVDGDSASSTEIYVLLSAIGNLPLRQDLAVTGSVNQFGQIQPVGGISEKIEGFYATCTLMGLTGTQGVIIPRTNIQNLILSREVQDAVTDGQFSIFAVDSVDEGIEILTGVTAGRRNNDGHFPKNTVNGIVERRLRQMAGQVKDFS